MYKSILISTDGSDLAGKAVEHGLDLAKSVGAGVVFVTVTELWSPLDMAAEAQSGTLDAIEAYERAMQRSAEAILKDVEAKASSKGVEAQCRHVQDRKPSEGILETADAEDCDLIVMASHGRRGLERMVLGSETAEVIALSKRPVLVVR